MDLPTAAAAPPTPSRTSSGLDIKIENPTPHRLPEGENATPLEVIGTTASDKLVIIMVGLPATGECGDCFYRKKKGWDFS